MKIIEGLLNLIAPHDCLVCKKEGVLLCEACVVQTCLPIPERCYRCKKHSSDYAVCQTCRKSSSLHHVWARMEYNNVAKQLIHKLKFQSARSAATIMAEMMYEVLPILPSGTTVSYIPTATIRKRQRGFDHAKLIATELAEILGLRASALLVRSGQTRQLGSNREQRLKQLQGAFIARSNNVAGACVVLVDDIVTTGASLESAAAELKKQGAKKVYAITFAQK